MSLFSHASIVPGSRPLLLLHSALGTHAEMLPIAARFNDRSTFIPDLPGHGSSSAIKNPKIAAFADAIVSFLDENELTNVDMIGYSLGGYVALDLARRFTNRVGSVVAHAMKFYWTPDAIHTSVTSLDPVALKLRSEKHWLALERAHSSEGAAGALETVRDVISNFKLEQLSAESVGATDVPMILSVGDTDELVPLSELIALFNALDRSKASLAIYPNTRHAIRTLPLGLFEYTVRTFWSTHQSNSDAH